MLVLSRKVGETISIGHGIRITLTKIRGGRAWVGIEAPEEMRILRTEVQLKEQAEETAAAVPAEGSIS